MNNFDLSKIGSFGFSVQYQQTSKTLNISCRNNRGVVSNYGYNIASSADLYDDITSELKKLITDSTYSGCEIDVTDPLTISNDNFKFFIDTFLTIFVRDIHYIPIINTESLSQKFYDDVFMIISDHNRGINNNYPSNVDKTYHDTINNYVDSKELIAIACVGVVYDYFDILKECIRADGSLINNISILTTAARTNRLMTIKMLEALGADIHIDDDILCYHAIISGNYDVAEYMIRNGSKFDKYDNIGIVIACACGYNNIVDLLLMRGVPIDHAEGLAIKKAIKHRNDYAIKRFSLYGICRSKYFDDILDYAKSQINTGYDSAYRILTEASNIQHNVII